MRDAQTALTRRSTLAFWTRLAAQDLGLQVRFLLTVARGLGSAALTLLRRIRPRRTLALGLAAGFVTSLAAPAAIRSNHERRAAQELAALSGTLKAIYPGDERPLDPWGNPYRYEKTGDGFRIISAGPDGEFNTRDDLVEHVTLFRKGGP